MKKLLDKTVSVIPVSVLCALIPLLINIFFQPSRPLALTMCSSLFIACSVLLFHPSGNESLTLSLVFVLLVSLAAAAVCLKLRAPWIFAYVTGCDCVYVALRCRARFKEPGVFFKRNIVTDTVRFESRTAYMIAVIVAGCLSLLAGEPVLRWILAGVLVLIYAILSARVLTGRSFFVRPSREKSIRKFENDTYRATRPGMRYTDVDAERKTLYERVCRFMEDKRPYLDEHFETEDLSRHMGTNRTYISKTLSMFSGWNFSNFVNKFRVDYAVDLIKKDKNMLISEVASFSGFHSQTTFNQAFKFFVGVTPSEYKRHLWSRHGKSPSSFQEQERSDPSGPSSQDE